MAATVTLRGGASISYFSIVFSMGILCVPLCSVLLCFKNDCPSTCRSKQNMTRTHKEDIMMCCVYEYVHVHVRKNEYLRTPICVYKYTNAWDIITFHCVRSICELSLSDLPFRSTCALILPHLPVSFGLSLHFSQYLWLSYFYISALDHSASQWWWIYWLQVSRINCPLLSACCALVWLLVFLFAFSMTNHDTIEHSRCIPL